MTFFGGTSQDRHFYLLVFDPANPASRRLLNTRTSTLDGRPTHLRLDFLLHAAAIDRSGRYVTLYPTSADRAAPRHAAPNYLWDLATDAFTELPSIAARSNGHDAYGYGVRVNQDCCTSTTWDAAQWQLRALSSPLTTQDVITPVLTPRQVYLADHPSWHNARPDAWTPFISALYRYGANTVEWRAWDDEIIAVQTGQSAGQVWRLAHHRSDVRHDTDPRAFRSGTRRGPMSRPTADGCCSRRTGRRRSARILAPVTGGTARQDVFLLRLTLRARQARAPPAASRTVRRSPQFRCPKAGCGDSTRHASRPPASRPAPLAAWSAGALPAGLVLHPQTGAIGGAPREAGTFTFTVAVGSASRSSPRGAVVSPCTRDASASRRVAADSLPAETPARRWGAPRGAPQTS
jgi:hypothetical protein